MACARTLAARVRMDFRDLHVRSVLRDTLDQIAICVIAMEELAQMEFLVLVCVLVQLDFADLNALRRALRRCNFSYFRNQLDFFNS
jgi:hypothetical protein